MADEQPAAATAGTVQPPAIPAESSLTKHAPILLAGFILFAFLLMLVIMAFHTVPTENKDLVDTLLGVLGTAFAGVVGYFFGSNSSSKVKDATIASMTTKAP
jgi:dolichol kinase